MRCQCELRTGSGACYHGFSDCLDGRCLAGLLRGAGVTVAFAKTKTLQSHATLKHHRSICQDKNLTTSTREAITEAFAKAKTLPQAPAEPSPRHLPRQKPYHKHPRSLHQGICQDKNLPTSTRGAFTTAFAKTITLPQAPAEPSPRYLPKQKPYHKHPQSLHTYNTHPRGLHHGICQDQNLTTSKRGAFTTAFAQTKTLPQAPAEPSPRYLPKQKLHHKHP